MAIAGSTTQHSTNWSGVSSSAFKTLGLKPRDVVAALDTNSDNYIAGYYAAAKAGLTWLPLNYRAKDAELEYMINTAGAKVLLAATATSTSSGASRPS